MRKFLTKLLHNGKFQDKFVLIVGGGWSIGMLAVILMALSRHS